MPPLGLFQDHFRRLALHLLDLGRRRPPAARGKLRLLISFHELLELFFRQRARELRSGISARMKPRLAYTLLSAAQKARASSRSVASWARRCLLRLRALKAETMPAMAIQAIRPPIQIFG